MDEVFTNVASSPSIEIENESSKIIDKKRLVPSFAMVATMVAESEANVQSLMAQERKIAYEKELEARRREEEETRRRAEAEELRRHRCHKSHAFRTMSRVFLERTQSAPDNDTPPVSACVA